MLKEMVINKEEKPLKVDDLEESDEIAQHNPGPPKVQQTSVFERLAYGGGGNFGQQRTAITRRSEDNISTTNSISAVEPGPDKRRTGTRLQPTIPNSSVFDRLSSNDRKYNSRGKATNRAADLRAGKRGAKKPPDPAAVLQVPSSVSTTVDSNGGPSSSLLADLPEDEEAYADEDHQPVISSVSSLVQPPAGIINKSSDPSSNKKNSNKSARQPKRAQDRKSCCCCWRITRLPGILVERTSLARAALPVLPSCLAWICLLFNSLVPGTGTILSGLLGLCFGAPRFSAQVTGEHRFLALVINLIVGLSQTFCVLFCLVGWCWSLGWGIILVKTAGYYKSWKKKNKLNASSQQQVHGRHSRNHVMVSRTKSMMVDDDEDMARY